jgi:transcriptional regulator with GAF, ATPase, and Fis domain
MPSLIVYHEGIKPPLKFDLVKRIITMGRDKECDLVLQGEDTADLHAQITLEGDRYFLNASSKDHPVLLNGKQIRKEKLKQGDFIVIGKNIFRYFETELKLPAAEMKTDRGLQNLFEFSSKLMESRNVEEILSFLLDKTIELSRANKGFIILLEGGMARIRVARNIDKKTMPDEELVFSDSIIQKVLEKSEPVVIANTLANREFSECTSIISLKLNSVMCIPLKAHGNTIGLLYLGSDSILNLFNQASLDLLTVFASQASLIIENALLIDNLEKDNIRLKEEVRSKRFGEIIGSCETMQAVFQKVRKVAPTDINVLITGETGTGKELIAMEIHNRSLRNRGPFVAINCGAIPENLLESELFGYVRGAFTGAFRDTIGKFQAATGGTLFLDEIGELPLNLQVKILRAIEEKTITRVGSTRSEPVNIRIIAATNKNLENEVHEGKFREDLYYRLNVVTIFLPPLRDREDDVMLLARYFLKKFSDELGSKTKDFSPEAIRAMKKYKWHGNIRELENKIKKAVIFSRSSHVGAEDIELEKEKMLEIQPLSKAKENFEKEYIMEVLRLNNGNRTKTARDLDVDPRTIFRYLEKEKE